jgi:hypothetical protein
MNSFVDATDTSYRGLLDLLDYPRTPCAAVSYQCSKVRFGRLVGVMQTTEMGSEAAKRLRKGVTAES